MSVLGQGDIIELLWLHVFYGICVYIRFDNNLKLAWSIIIFLKSEKYSYIFVFLYDFLVNVEKVIV